MSKGRRGWIDEDFYRKLKVAAVKNDMQVTEFTRRLAKSEEFDEFMIRKSKKKEKRGFHFGL